MIIYKCDRCGKNSPHEDDFETLRPGLHLCWPNGCSSDFWEWMEDNGSRQAD